MRLESARRPTAGLIGSGLHAGGKPDAERMQLSVIDLLATEDGYPLYQKVGFKDDESKYHPMKWRPSGSH